MRSKYQRVHVEYFCTRCGKVEFEGVVFGQYRSRHLRATSPEREMVCDTCLAPPKLPFTSGLGAFFTDPENHPIPAPL